MTNVKLRLKRAAIARDEAMDSNLHVTCVVPLLTPEGR